MKELGIFIDESGDFGEYDYHSPWYIVTMVFHDQNVSIQEPMEYLEKELSLLGLKNHCIHTGPIIRKEEEYSAMDYLERRKIFNKMVTFMRQSKVKYKSFYVEKKHIEDRVLARCSWELIRIKQNFIYFVQCISPKSRIPKSKTVGL